MVSLARAADLAVAVFVDDERFADFRYRVYDLIDGEPHCAAVVVRGESVRIISLRRAHRKEYQRHV